MTDLRPAQPVHYVYTPFTPLGAVLVLAASCALVAPAWAEPPPLADLMAQCELYARDGLAGAFADLDTEPDENFPEEVDVAFVETREGLAQLRLVRTYGVCWILGARDIEGRRTTQIDWNTVGPGIVAALAARDDGKTAKFHASGAFGSLQLCEEGLATVHVAASSGGTDDPARTLVFSARRSQSADPGLCQ